LLTLSQKERDDLVVVRQVAEGLLSVAEGARRLDLSRRQMRRRLGRYEVEGDRSVIHGLRGRPSNHRLPEELKRQALERARLPLYRDFGPTLLSEHLERDEIGVVHPATLRLWMIAEGLWQPRTRRQRHRRRRERRAAFGELVLMDTSIHDWLEQRSSAGIVLIALIDDATSRLYARFFPKDDGASNRRLLIDYIERHGRMGALYTDRAPHFQLTPGPKRRQEKDAEAALTIIERGLNALDIELIRALSPQAKGRVERLFGTLQDRLIKEMRVQNVSSLEEANRFLEAEFIPFWNQRFAQPPQLSVDAHRALAEDNDLLRLFAKIEERVIGNDFSFRYLNRFYQIEARDSDGLLPKTRIIIEQRLDGTVRFRWRERYLLPTPLFEPPSRARERPPLQHPQPLRGAATKPIPVQHPWRRFPIRVGKNARPTSPAPRATRSTPQPSEAASTP
jgi:hypothetical protein